MSLQENIRRSFGPEMYYNMRHKNRGQALIFNHKKFSMRGVTERKGTDEDCRGLTNSLENLGFAVTVCQDFNFVQILEKVEQVSREDHRDNDCFLVAILTHGDHSSICAKDTKYTVDNISNYFTADRCITLAQKPKLFFIQACRGEKEDSGVALTNMETDADPLIKSSIPVHADFLFMYSSIPEYRSFRSIVNGSWFMQALISELNENALNCDIQTLLTFVNKRVAHNYIANAPDNPRVHGKKQMPCVTSMLTRILHFTDKGTAGMEIEEGNIS